MSVSARCIAIGVVVFLYWVAAFMVALMNVLPGWAAHDDMWWNIAWLREPGLGLGEWVFELLEMVPGWNYAHWSFFLALFLTAASMGTGAWLLSALVAGCWLRGNRFRQSTAP